MAEKLDEIAVVCRKHGYRLSLKKTSIDTKIEVLGHTLEKGTRRI